MKRIINVLIVITIFLSSFTIAGCERLPRRERKPKVYTIPFLEAEWIRNGEAIRFENELWFPVDSVENLLDSEVYWMGKYRDTDFFVERIDVKPYNRLYTKFGKNKFRVFKKNKIDD